MKRFKAWLVFSIALLFVIGTFTVGFAATKTVKADASDQPTRDTRTLFGHDVEGLKPVSLVYAGDGQYNTLGDAMLVCFKKLVETESKGKITIDAHRHGSLYRTNDLPKVMPIGTVHVGGINKGLLLSREKGYAPWIIGYIWENPEHMVALTCSKEWYELEDRLAKKKWNLKHLVNVNVGNWDYWSKKEIKGMDDFGGKRVWSYGELSNAYIAAWGGTPVLKSFGEMYMAYYKDALQIVSSGIGLYHTYKLYDIGKYYLNMPTYPPGSVGIHYVAMYMNRDKWNTLPTAYKKILLDAYDLMSWAGSFDAIAREKLHLYRMINEHGLIDVGISTKYPKEYEKIKKAAVAAGKEYVFKRGISQKEWDETQHVLKKYADPKITSKYIWWYELAWAEADRRVEEVKKALAAGKTWDEAYEPYHAKRLYDWSAEKVKQEWMSTPRIKWEWDEASRLK